MENENVLNSILEARENRASLRLSFAKQNYNTLSLSLNIPGYPKSNALILNFFKHILTELKIFTEAERIPILSDSEILQTDAAGDFYLVPFICQNVDIEHIKLVAEKFENTHKIGRLIDIDVFDTNAKPVSSGKHKRCYFCGKHSAISCMREQRHTYAEIRNKIFTDIQSYSDEIKKEHFIKNISSLALKAVLYEVSVSPKPGLVDFNHSGSHSDMNYFTFLNSSASLSQFFREFCLTGFENITDYKDVLPKIRTIGLHCEKAMYESTGGVNTQKGLIFLFGICLFSFSFIKFKEMDFSEKNFRDIVKKITKNIVKNELMSDSSKRKTHGETVFKKYGNIGAGVRYEVEQGFAAIFKTAMPYLNENSVAQYYGNQEQLQQILIRSLLLIMAENNDSNILYRSNIETLNEIKKIAEKATNNFDEYKKLCEYCKLKNVSPGGSADLSAVALFIHFVLQEFKQ